MVDTGHMVYNWVIVGGVAMKKKVRKSNILLSMLVILVAIIAVAWYKMPLGEIEADYPFYNSMDELVDRADLIIIGEAISSGKVKKLNVNADKESREDNEDKLTPYTISEVRVNQVIKGDVSVGETITVKQLVDINRKPEARLKDIDGYLKKGTQYVMFLKGYKEIGLDVPYSILNPDQGALKITNAAININGYNPLFNDSESLSSVKKKILDACSK